MSQPQNPLSSLTVSLNGADNVGKSTQLRWLERGLPGSHLVGTIGGWNLRWEQLAAGDFPNWWFETSSTREHVDLVFASHRARREGSGALALEDRGRPMLLALCAATAAVKEGYPVEQALDLVQTIAQEHPAAERREIHVLLRHSQYPDEEAQLALAREQHEVSRWYADYQWALARIIDCQARRGDYDIVVLRGGRPILPVQNELRQRLRTTQLPLEPLAGPTPERLVVLAGMSESGKSTIGDLLRAEHGLTRLKIGYLIDVAASRAGVTNPYATWDECQQAEVLSEEILRFCRDNKVAELVLESAHRFDATQHLQRVWGELCQLVYVRAGEQIRVPRTQEDPESVRRRDGIKRARGTERIAGIADTVIDNSGSLAALKLAANRLRSADAGEAPQVARVVSPGDVAPLGWLNEALLRILDSSVAVVMATGSTGQPHWRSGWSDIDLLIVRDALPLTWIRDTVAILNTPGVKTGVSMFTTDEVLDGRVPPRVLHAFRLVHSNRGVLFVRDGFRVPDPGFIVDDRASRGELPLVVMTLRRLIAASPIDLRATYKHLVLIMKIILRADEITTETPDDVLQRFQIAHPSAGVDLPTQAEMAAGGDDKARENQVLLAADLLLRYYDSLGSIFTELDRPQP